MFLKAVNQVRKKSFSLAKWCWFGVEFFWKATGEVGCEVPLKCGLSYTVSPRGAPFGVLSPSDRCSYGGSYPVTLQLDPKST